MLTEERFLLANLDKQTFFATGEADVAALDRRVEPALPRTVRARALDFGCGVGRLTRALATRYEHVVGVDVSPTMLRLARENVPNATFQETIPDETFDLIVSLIVLQHVPVDRGLGLLRQLLERLAKDGVLVLQVPVRRAGGPIRRVGRWVRGRVPIVHRLVSRLRGDRRGLPYMQMNAYPESTIRREIERAGCLITSMESAGHDNMVSVTLIARKL